ncbi:hypothetical protein [Nonomuraea sp. C10]|uniref:hypothetical protein n=1 Tax=Nonomuraea sp. C10 TaxID=2600577 RepID=UPI0011CD9BCB|nr:hypothetical protein [Nonomuraea sp. C10]TXK34873.1 hypothetical protein FR742_36845 [Nonomuraea sp. C10]
MIPPPPAQHGTRAIIALVLGAILTISGPVLGVLAGSLATVPQAIDYVDNTIRIGPAGTVELDAGESVFLLAPVGDLEHADYRTCRAHTGEDEAAVSYEPASALNTLVNGARYESFARVTATIGGEYTITCDAGVDVVAAPPFHGAEVFEPFAWWTAGGIVLSLLGVVGVILGIVGLTRTRQANGHGSAGPPATPSTREGALT